MALKDVIIGYAKGDKGDKGDTGERGATGQTGPQGEPGNIADAAITDTQGLDVAKGTKTTAQKLFDAIADRIVNKLVTNDTLTTKLADYLLKSAMSSTNINSTTNVPTSALVYSLLQDVNNNLSKKLFVKIGDTSNGNHSQIDQIADFYGITWVNSNYNSTFGGQWCFIDSTIIDNSGPYAMQRIMSCENAAVLATRYCTKGTWGAWNVGVTKSEIKVTNYFDRIKPDSAYINGYNNNEQCAKLIEISDNIKIVNINLAVKTKALNKIEAQIIELPAQIRPQKNVVFTAYANKEPAFAYYSSGKIMFIYNKALTENAEIDIIASYLI